MLSCNLAHFLTTYHSSIVGTNVLRLTPFYKKEGIQSNVHSELGYQVEQRQKGERKWFCFCQAKRRKLFQKEL